MQINAAALNTTALNGASGAPTHQAAGATSTAFGTPTSSQASPAVSLGSVTAFGTPASPSLQTCVATGAGDTAFGYPYGTRYTAPVMNRTAAARALMATAFGLPDAATAVSGAATGVGSGAFGLPRSARTHSAVGDLPSTVFGSAYVVSGARAVGGMTTVFGAPISGRSVPATSLFHATRWGAPSATRSNTYLASGVSISARFGRPGAFRLNAHPAVGAQSTAFGTPASTQCYRALHLAPTTRLGRPTMLRNPPC